MEPLQGIRGGHPAIEDSQPAQRLRGRGGNRRAAGGASKMRAPTSARLGDDKPVGRDDRPAAPARSTEALETAVLVYDGFSARARRM